jgi:hypothetical protein
MSTQPDSGNYSDSEGYQPDVDYSDSGGYQPDVDYSDSGGYQPDVDYSDSGNYQVSSGEEGVMSGDPHLSPLFGEKYDL